MRKRKYIHSGKTVLIGLPAAYEHYEAATEKLLLSLWQSSAKHLVLQPRRAPIALEYVACDGVVRFQLHVSSALLAAVVRTVLVAHIPNVETTTLHHDALDSLGTAGVVVRLRFRRSGTALARDAAPEASAAMLATLAASEPDALSLVQLLLQPCWLRDEDGQQPAFQMAGRVVTTGSQTRAADHARLIAATFGQLASLNGISSSAPEQLTTRKAANVVSRTWPHVLFPPPAGTAAELAALVHPPTHAADVSKLYAFAYARPPVTDGRTGIIFGEGRSPEGKRAAVLVAPDDLLRHALVLGPSGAGKTSFLAHLARELVRAGHGVSVLDPHGGLIRELATTVPAGHERRGLLFRFADYEHPIAINALRARDGHEFLVVDQLVEILQRVQGRDYWGPMLDLVLRHASLAASELGGSLLDIARLLDDPTFRADAAARVKNPETARFLDQLSGLTAADRRLLPAVNRLQRLISAPWLRNTLGQHGAGLQFAELFERRSVALFDLSEIGATNAKLLGSLLLLLVRQAVFSRPAEGDGARHYLLVDEASWFVSRTVGELFDQARKFGLGVILATQRVSQLRPDETREAITGNAGTVVTFQLHDHDEAVLLSRRFGSERLAVSDFQHLPRFEAYARLAGTTDPVWFRPPSPTTARRREDLKLRLIELARARYTRPRAEVEAELCARDRLLAHAEPEIRTLPAPTIPADAT